MCVCLSVVVGRVWARRKKEENQEEQDWMDADPGQGLFSDSKVPQVVWICSVLHSSRYTTSVGSPMNMLAT